MVRPFFKNRPPLAEVVAEHGPGRRMDPRVYFHDGDTPYAEQSSGVPAQVKIPLLLFSYRVGRAVIKDLSLGGVGFLAPTRLNLPDHVCLQMENAPKLHCRILHRRQVAPLLTFYGACWYPSNRREMEKIMAQWVKANEEMDED